MMTDELIQPESLSKGSQNPLEEEGSKRAPIQKRKILPREASTLRTVPGTHETRGGLGASPVKCSVGPDFFSRVHSWSAEGRHRLDDLKIQ